MRAPEAPLEAPAPLAGTGTLRRRRASRLVTAGAVLAGLIVAVGAWRLLSGPPPAAQAVRTPPPAAQSGPEASTPAREAVPRAAPAANPPDGSPPRFTVQVASFRTRSRAEASLARASESTGLGGLVVASRVDGIVWQRILLGAFATEEEAKAALAPLLREGFLTEIVVRPIEEEWLPSLLGQTGNEEVQ